jgi:pimeloyl-ACP methyl ester carboxylesterase
VKAGALGWPDPRAPDPPLDHSYFVTMSQVSELSLILGHYCRTMAIETVNGLSIGYDVIGHAGPPWAITPGGRFSRETPGVRELATALAEHGNRVLIWDRPNTGESDVCFEGSSESVMQADVLAALLSRLGLAPAVIVGGSGGARVSLLAAARHRQVATALAVLWVSGGIYGLMTLGTHYCGASIAAAWSGGMEAVCALPEWEEVLARNPGNRRRFLDQDPQQFVAILESWMAAYCACGGELVPGLPDEQARHLDIPALVFRSGTTDLHHRRETTERLAELLPNARLVEPPWGDDEWNERSAARPDGRHEGLFVRWPLLTPMLTEWAAQTLGPADSAV